MPSEEDVDTFLSFIGDGLSRDVATTVLRQQGTIEAAVNKYYDSLDNPHSLVQTEDHGYDPSAFGADRYGESDPASLPAFRIDTIDNFAGSGSQSVAPSRPPSRISQHGGSHANSDIPIQSIESGQESGVIGGSKPMFGPANKDQVYDADRWAMVPVSRSTEYIPDAAPSQRKREEEGPAIIKPSPNMDYLPALLTILHSIPLFRNSLLAPEILSRNYNAGEEWWKGTSAAGGSTVTYETDDKTLQHRDVIYETQRLMAFLDRTDRAYGSVGGLQQLDAWKIAREDMGERPNDELLKFLLTWGDAYHNLTAKPLDGVFRSVISAEGQEQSSALLDANVIHHNPDTDVTLYDVLDENLFESVAGQGTAFIKDASNVLILRLESSDGKGMLDCKIPATLYADRYLEENKDAIAAMVQERRQCDARVREIDAEAANIKFHKTKIIRPGEQVETLKLLKSSMLAFQQRPDDLIHDPKSAAILAQLQSVHDRIERKLTALEVQKKHARKTLDDMSSRFKAPIIDGGKSVSADGKMDGLEIQPNEAPTKHPYKLCGVATHSNVVYLLHPDAKTNEEDTQWWRMEYTTPMSDAYILRERLSLSSVLEQASQENRSALLVYANAAAIDPDPEPLSDALERFVKSDNISFQEELLSAVEPVGSWNHDPPAYQDSANQSYETKRRWDSNGGWGESNDDDPSSWENISAGSYFGQDTKGANSGNDGHDQRMRASGVQEMQEVNGGIDAWAGVSDASSDTIGGEVMEIVNSSQGQNSRASGRDAQQHQQQSRVELRDVEMDDDDLVDLGQPDRMESSVQHIEVIEKPDEGGLERKGG